jgi:hypothetical protein
MRVVVVVGRADFLSYMPIDGRQGNALAHYTGVGY